MKEVNLMSIKDCEPELNKSQRQMNQQGTPIFPCSAYFTDIKNNLSGELPWHWHGEIEVFIVKSGVVQLNICGETHVLEKGVGCFINTNTLHSARVVGDESCILHSLLFHSSLVSGSIESFFEQHYVRPLLNATNLPIIILQNKIDWQKEAIEAIHDAYDAYKEENHGFEWVVREKLSRIWYLIIRNMESQIKQENPSKNRDLVRLKTMLDYIHQNYENPITLSEIAASANISSRESLRCFQKVIGVSPMKYLLKHRISSASRLLLETNHDITTICREVGIDSPSYFSKKFKDFIGCTPTEYRKQNF